MNNDTLIELNDTFMDAIVKLSKGNPGAVTVLMQMTQHGPVIDPDCAFGPLGPLLALDTYSIYGSRIWMLYKDACNHSVTSTLALLRAVQFGFLPEHQLHHAIDNRGDGINVPDLVGKVAERLPRGKWLQPVEKPEAVVV